MNFVISKNNNTKIIYLNAIVNYVEIFRAKSCNKMRFTSLPMYLYTRTHLHVPPALTQIITYINTFESLKNTVENENLPLNAKQIQVKLFIYIKWKSGDSICNKLTESEYQIQKS